MPKKTLSAVPSSSEFVDVQDEDLIRVEESVEDFLLVRMPEIAGCKMKVVFHYTNKSGSSFFRVHYWKYSHDGFLVTRKEQDSRYVRVDKIKGQMSLVDLTVYKTYTPR